MLSAYVRGAYGPSNLGDDVLMLVMVSLLNSILPAETIVVGVVHPEISADWYPGIRWFKRGEHANLRVRALVHGGGGQFFSFSRPRLALTSRPFLLRILASLDKRRPFMNRLLRLSSSRGTLRSTFPVTAEHSAAFCVGVGPFVPDATRTIVARKALTNCSYISVRDQESRDLCLSWGLSHTKLATDAAFLRELWLGDTQPSVRAATNHKDSVAFVFRSWPHSFSGQKYFQPMLRAAARLRNRGVNVDYIVLSKDDDCMIVPELQKRGKVRVWDPAANRPSHFVREIASAYDVIVSSRAHGVILPALLGVPAVCAAIEPKLENVHRLLPMGTAVWRAPFQAQELEAIVLGMLDHRDRYSDLVLREAEKNCTVARQAASDFLLWLQYACGLVAA